MAKQKVCAIVPAYNEEDRIENTLIPLSKSELVDEIIVVDDGSDDNTEMIVKKYNPVRYIKNEMNMGKGNSFVLMIKGSCCGHLRRGARSLSGPKSARRISVSKDLMLSIWITTA